MLPSHTFMICRQQQLHLTNGASRLATDAMMLPVRPHTFPLQLPLALKVRLIGLVRVRVQSSYDPQYLRGNQSLSDLCCHAGVGQQSRAIPIIHCHLSSCIILCVQHKPCIYVTEGHREAQNRASTFSTSLRMCGDPSPSLSIRSSTLSSCGYSR